MNVMTPAAAADTNGDQDLMTRRQVAYLFRVTSAAVASWARRGRLPEVRDQAGRPRYRRAEVQALLRRGPGQASCSGDLGPDRRGTGQANRVSGPYRDGQPGGPDHPDWPSPPRH